MNNRKNTILITGAAGFIGKNAAKFFKEHGWRVVGIDLKEQEGEMDGWYSGTITKELLANIKEKPDVVLHCAGGSSVGFSIENPEEDYKMNVESAKNVLEFIKSECPDIRLIFLSSAAVYGQKENIAISEADSLNPVSPYGRNKKMAEDLCREYLEKYNISISIVRLFSVYGSGLHKQIFWDACNKIKDADKSITFFGTGEETRDFVHINDINNLFLILSESKNKFEIINCGSGKSIKMKTVLEVLRDKYKKDVQITFNQISKEGDPKFYQANIGKALALGWKPVIELKNGIEEYVNYFKKI